MVTMKKNQLVLQQETATRGGKDKRSSAVERYRRYYLSLVNEDRQDWERIGKEYGQIRRVWAGGLGDEMRLEFVGALFVYQERHGLWGEGLAWAKRGLQVAGRKGRILFCSCSIPYNSASAVGGQPGTYTSTGTTRSQPRTTA